MQNQQELFSESNRPLRVEMPCADVTVYSRWLDEESATQAFHALKNELPWEQPDIVIAGKTMAIPRMQVWCGDGGANMRYSGVTFTPHPWHPVVATIRARLQKEYVTGFNSALINLYRNGLDSVAWHADDEPELGAQPVIASLSLGAERVFKFKSRNKTNETRNHKPVQLILKNGDLVIMKGRTQHHWLHCVPKCDISTPTRINLTFRYVSKVS